MFGFVTWDVDPTIFSLGPLSIRYYGLFWALGIWFVLVSTTKIFRREKLPEVWIDKLFLYILIGAVVGARLGHCFFYEWHPLKEPVQFLGITFTYGNEYFLKPWQLIKIWEGGLASHGGTLGIIIAVYLCDKKHIKRGIVFILDRVIIGVTVCAALIRLGNLMNSEIFGVETTLPWGFKFLRSHEWNAVYSPNACHPTQIYEMICYLLTFGVTLFLYLKTDAIKRSGTILGAALLCIFCSRFLLEFVKNNQESFEDSFALNMGQLLSLPLIIWALYLVLKNVKFLKK